MEYHQEVLNRATGRLETKSIGDWIPVTELGRRYGKGSRTTRMILHHMGVLAQEGGRYRLPHELVEAGIGLRHDKSNSGYPFDAISPLGQDLIASVWDDTARDYEEECRKDKDVSDVRASLASFKATRLSTLDTRQEVYWVLDHFRDVQLQTVALALEVSPALVTRYSTERSRSRQTIREKKNATLPRVKREVGDRFITSGLSSTAPIETIGMSSGEALSSGYITEGLYIPKNGPAPTLGQLFRYAPSLYRLSPRQRHYRVR